MKTTDPELDGLRREWHEQPFGEMPLRRRFSRGSGDRWPAAALTIMAALLLVAALGARATAGSRLETVVVLVGTALLMLAVWIVSTLDRNDAGGAGAEGSAVSTYIAYSVRRRGADARRLGIGIAAHAAVLVTGGAWIVWRDGDWLPLWNALTTASVGALVLVLVVSSLAVLAKRLADVRRQLVAFMSLQAQWNEDDVGRETLPSESRFRSRRRKAPKTL